jgi:hypothetical protein
LFANGVNILSTVGSATTYSNANVASYLPTYSGNISAGNISVTTGIFWSNGTAWSSSSGSGTIYSNANVAAFLSNSVQSTGNIYAGNLIASGTFTTAGITTTGTYGNITGANVISANTVQVSNGIFWANGTAWSSSSGTIYSNANVASYLLTNTGNISAGNIIANLYGTQYGNTVGTSATYSGNVSANYFVGNGAALTGISTVGNIYGTSPNVTLVAGTYSFTFDNTGNLTMPTNSDLVFSGNTTLTSTAGSNGNITINPNGTGQLVVTAITPAWFGNTVTILGNTNAGNVLATGYFYANGIPFISSNYGNTQVAAYLVANPQTGTYSNTNVASYMPVYSGNIVANVITANNIVSNGYVSASAVYASTIGNTGATLTGTLSTAAQTNITSVGTLTALSVTGNITAGNINATQYGNSIGTTATYSSVVTAGNIITTNGIFWANGTAYSSGSGGGTYSNTNVASYLLTNTGNIAAGNIIVGTEYSTNVSTGNVIASANIYGANIITTGTTSGNISGANWISANTFQVSNGIFWANGTAWSSSSGGGTYSNTNVASYLPVYSGNIGTSGTTTANVIATFYGNLYGNVIGTQYGNSIGTTATYTGNVTLANVVSTLPNVSLVAGSYTTTFDNTGNITLPNIGNVYINSANTSGAVILNTTKVVLLLKPLLLTWHLTLT